MKISPYFGLLLLGLLFVLSCDEKNPVQPLVCDDGLTDVDGVCVFLCEEGLTNVDGVCTLVCDDGLTDVDGVCYYQGDLDVLQDIIDVNESLSGEEPLEIDSQRWVDGRLEYLNLYYIQLTSIPESIGNLSSLTYLSLSGNQFTTLPESIGNLSSLTQLDLDYNQLTILPESIGGLSSLEWLYLSYNQLTTLPESIGDLSSLEELGLTYNQLTTLPESICNFSYCHIRVSNNQLCEEYHYDCIQDWGTQDCEE